MATLRELYNLAYDQQYEAREQLIARITAALANAAKGVLSEDPATANHANRLAWAKSVLLSGDPRAMAEKLKWFFVSDGPIANAMIAGQSIEDASIEYLAQVNIDLFAPATASEV